jgi:hypothetical protein
MANQMTNDQFHKFLVYLCIFSMKETKINQHQHFHLSFSIQYSTCNGRNLIPLSFLHSSMLYMAMRASKPRFLASLRSTLGGTAFAYPAMVNASPLVLPGVHKDGVHLKSISSQISSTCIPSSHRCYSCRPFSTSNESSTWRPIVDEYEDEAQLPRWTTKAWSDATHRLLHKTDLKKFTVQDILDARDCARYWTTVRDETGVKNAIRLYELIIVALLNYPILVTDSRLVHWYEGRHPKMTMLLNAIVDSWRIVRETHPNNQLLSPDEMLQFLQNLNSEQPRLLYNSRTYSCLMHGYMTQYETLTTPSVCESILRSMLESEDDRVYPDTVTFTLVLKICSLCCDSDRAMRLLQEWEDLIDKGVLAEAPNTISYNTVMEALAHTQRSENMEIAEKMLERMRLSLSPDTQPDVVSIRTIVHGWLNVKELTLDIWKHAKDLTYIYLLAAYNKQQTQPIEASFFSKLMHAAAIELNRSDLAEEVFLDLRKFHQLTGLSQLEPDQRTLQTLVIAYSKLRRPEKAQPVLEYLVQQARAGQQRSLYPKRNHFRDVIRGWIASNDPKWLEHAQEMLFLATDVELEMGGEPDDSLLERLLYALVRSEEKDMQAVIKAHALFAAFRGRYPHVPIRDFTSEHLRQFRNKRFRF